MAAVERAEWSRYDRNARRLFVLYSTGRRMVFLDVPPHIAASLNETSDIDAALNEHVVKKYGWVEQAPFHPDMADSETVR